MYQYENHQMVFLEEGENTIGYFTLQPNPKNLIIFVHGFGGKSITTWGDFAIIIKNFSEFKETDVIFYGYNSKFLPAIGNSEKFYRYLKSFIDPKKTIGNNKRGDTIDSYENILFVGHSLGAIIIRRTLLDAKRDNKPWLNSSKIILYAPAHKGANIQRLIIEGLPELLKFVGSLAKLICPALNDLEANSETIAQLIKDNEFYLQDVKNNTYTKAAHILASTKDKVVLKHRFCDDPNVESIDDKGHIKICKPILFDYLTPLTPVKNNIL